MTSRATEPGLVWITERQAINPAAVVSVFRGGGQVVIELVAGDALRIPQQVLTVAGRQLLLPDGAALHEERARDRVQSWALPDIR